MPTQAKTKQGARRRVVAKPQKAAPAASRPVLYLETTCGDRPPKWHYILREFHKSWWEEWMRRITGDAQRIRAHSHANYPQRTQEALAMLANNADNLLERTAVLATYIGETLVQIECRFEAAQEWVEQAEAKMLKGRSRRGSKRTE